MWVQCVPEVFETFILLILSKNYMVKRPGRLPGTLWYTYYSSVSVRYSKGLVIGHYETIVAVNAPGMSNNKNTLKSWK